MISKLVMQKLTIAGKEYEYPDTTALVEKINELADAVSALIKENNIHEKQIDELQMKIEPEKCETPADPYAEQRRWIGKLCKFWDDDAFITSNDWAFGILTSIDKGMQSQYCCNENCNFKHCEPVKPDDDIIYKGARNE